MNKERTYSMYLLYLLCFILESPKQSFTNERYCKTVVTFPATLGAATNLSNGLQRSRTPPPKYSVLLYCLNTVS